MVKKLIAPACLFLALTTLLAIEKEPFGEYKARRERLAARIKGNVLVLRAAPDQELVKYQQERNFYYLTGFDQPFFLVQRLFGFGIVVPEHWLAWHLPTLGLLLTLITLTVLLLSHEEGWQTRRLGDGYGR